MTKIAIVPNAAGTGTFTIEAPNSNSNRTLVLPDAAGTVMTDATTLLTSQLPAQLSVSSSAAAGALTVDASGRVLMAGQPAFSAWNIGATTPLSGNITLNTVLLNTGGHYSSSTGRFTAPVAGVYYFSFTGFTENNSSGSADIAIRRNDIAIVRTFTSEAVNTYRPFAVHCIIFLAAGDYINPNSAIQLHSNQNPVFSGHLIG
jgi:hypothetical protein